MENISVFDMLKIGVGPSSSHTLGPWRAAQRFCKEICEKSIDFTDIKITLYGSLALTGKGHGTDFAVIMGLSGFDPVTVTPQDIREVPLIVKHSKSISLNGEKKINFDPESAILFKKEIFLPQHSNGLKFELIHNKNTIYEETYFSIGGGFVVKDGEEMEFTEDMVKLPYPVDTADDLKKHCLNEGKRIAQIVAKNEASWRSKEEVNQDLDAIWNVMLTSVYDGCHTSGYLPGGLNVKRRAADIYERLKPHQWQYENQDEWLEMIRMQRLSFSEVMNWISCFSMAVNEVNADFGKIVTAPTNGASGVIPAVLMYFICFSERQVKPKQIGKFLLVAGEIGSIFKKGATISAAMGGCQAEIGVSSSMAAAALTEGLGGTVEQALMAAEIAMEHHLGLTCDPIGGLVQVPCIERNSMGAIKAIMAANLALSSDPSQAKVSLDNVVATMIETAQDMHLKYKETSTGGLATKLAIQLAEC